MEDHPLSFTSQFIPGLQDKTDAEGFAGGIGGIKVFEAENLPPFYRRQTPAAGLIKKTS
jgi:hypothetical protein